MVIRNALKRCLGECLDELAGHNRYGEVFSQDFDETHYDPDLDLYRLPHDWLCLDTRPSERLVVRTGSWKSHYLSLRSRQPHGRCRA